MNPLAQLRGYDWPHGPFETVAELVLKLLKVEPVPESGGRPCLATWRTFKSILQEGPGGLVGRIAAWSLGSGSGLSSSPLDVHRMRALAR